ncbi:MAG: hypothetical protein WC421_06265 [Elusimicrobiales bacterium]
MASNLKQANNKGFALIMVLGIILFMTSSIVCTMVMMNSKMEDLRQTLDRTIARSACEAGASMAVLAIGSGKSSGTTTFTYNVGNTPCKITYTISRAGGTWTVKVTTPSPMGFSTVYTLEASGQRSFPFFIKGPGALM